MVPFSVQITYQGCCHCHCGYYCTCGGNCCKNSDVNVVTSVGSTSRKRSEEKGRNNGRNKSKEAGRHVSSKKKKENSEKHSRADSRDESNQGQEGRNNGDEAERIKSESNQNGSRNGFGERYDKLNDQSKRNSNKSENRQSNGRNSSQSSKHEEQMDQEQYTNSNVSRSGSSSQDRSRSQDSDNAVVITSETWKEPPKVDRPKTKIFPLMYDYKPLLSGPYYPIETPVYSPEKAKKKHRFTSKSPNADNSPYQNLFCSPEGRSNVRKTKQSRKQLSQSSRYLSNTAFRKYFNRQCFENYGNANTHDRADGLFYNNYLKTHSINPHTGINMPPDDQTFNRALMSASPDKCIQTDKLMRTTRLEATNLFPRSPEYEAIAERHRRYQPQKDYQFNQNNMEAEYLLSNAGKTLAKGKSKTRKKCQKIHKEGEDCSYCRNYVQHGRQDLADNHRAAQQLSNRVPSGRQW